MDKFEVGKTYTTRSIIDSGYIHSYKILSRTDKTVTAQDWDGEIVKRRVFTDYDNSEAFAPLGRYSMAPIIRATRPA